MKSFKEISQNIIPLSEGMFDMQGEDRLAKGVEKDLTEMFLKTCKGDFKPVFFKDGSCRINGKLIISRLTTDKIYLNCKDFHGKLIIENCPNLTTLQGSFLEKMVVFDGSITINQCPELVSVMGLPGLIKGDLSITNCKKLKSYEGIDMVYGNFYWQGNGKKYTPEQLKDKVHVIKKIFCSGEEIEADINESMISEAFNNPWLQRLAAQFKKYPYKEYSWGDNNPDKFNTIDRLFDRYSRVSHLHSRLLDKISNEDIDVYDMGSEKDKKELSKAFYDAYNAQNGNAADIMLVYNEEIEEFVGCFGAVVKNRGAQNAGVEWVIFPHKAPSDSSWDKHSGEMKTSWYTKTDAKNKLLNYGNGYTVVVINTGEDTGTSWDERSKIKQDRINSQEGMITPGDEEQYKKIAAANMKRYKDLVAQLRLSRKKSDESAGYDKIIDEYEKINNRIIKLVRAIAKNPGSFNKYEVTGFLNWVRDEQRRNPNYKYWQKNSGPSYYGEYGLMYYFRLFMDDYMSCFGGGYYKSSPDNADYQALERSSKNMKAILQVADKKLTKFGV